MDRMLADLLKYLPDGIASELTSLAPSSADELRLRLGGACTVLSSGKRIILRSTVSRDELDLTFKSMCGGSVYAHRETICRGYIALPGGIRVGIVGTAVTEGGTINAIVKISSMCIRLPHDIRSVGAPVQRLIERSEGSAGVLVYSPPGVGKTTLLRSVIIALGSRTRSPDIAVVDTRGELGCFLPRGLSADLLTGYPRGKGIEFATRTLAPRLIVCDEIGGDINECKSIIAAYNCGVPLLASAHAATVSELMRRPGISMLCDAGVFGHLVGIRRPDRGGDYEYRITALDGKDKCRLS